MANIIINEISQNYTYNIGRSSYAQVALPITSCWGPGFFEPANYGKDKQTMLEETVWNRFPATQEGLEAFVSTYRGPASNYRTFKDYSYQMAMTLLTAGYDVLVCRICPGTNAQGVFQIDEDTSFVVKAKYPGTFGNSLRVTLKKVRSAALGHDYWNIITYIVDASGVKTAVENKVFVFDIENSTDNILHIDEIESNFLDFGAITGKIDETTAFSYDGVTISLSGGSDITPMPTSEAYDEAVASLKELNAKLAEYAADIETYTSAVNNDNSHIAKLDLDIASYQNRIDEENSKVPVDEALVQELTDKKTAAEDEKATWEKRLNGDDDTGEVGDATKLAAAKTNYNDTLNGVLDEHGEVVTKGIVQYKADIESESDGFRQKMIDSALSYAAVRYDVLLNEEAPKLPLDAPEYLYAINNLDAASVDNAFCLKLMNQEWVFTNSCDVYDLLKDKLSYSPNRIISPGWDDQNISDITGEDISRLSRISPLHIKLMDVAYFSRCATSMIDIPKCLPRSAVYDDANGNTGYAQMLARYVPENSEMDVNGSLYSTHSALFAPWGQYKYVGTGKQNPASPAFQALMIQRAMILNQANQYEWALPTNRKHNVALGKLDYTVPKKLLDVWQKLEGVGVNVITNIPEMGISLWGNSTLYEVPPATYQALANLSTRFLVNAVENVVYKCGISITFKYNNEDAYSAFYAGVTPILDLMKNVGAIEDYYVRMSSDINGLDQVNANSVIGKVYLVVNGVINDITVDLIALPPGADLDVYKA